MFKQFTYALRLQKSMLKHYSTHNILNLSKQINNFLEKLNSKSARKNNPFQICEISPPGFTEEFLGRDQQIIDFLTYASERNSQRKRTQELRFYNNYVTVASAPGGGKTRFIGELAKILVDPEKYKNEYYSNISEEFRNDIKENLIALPITLNHRMGFNSLEEIDKHPYSSFNLRLLYSYLLPESMDFLQFRDNVAPEIYDFIKMRPTLLFKYIYEDAKKILNGRTPHFFLGIDELAKAKEIPSLSQTEDPLVAIISSVGEIITSFPTIYHCMTTLDVAGFIDANANKFAFSKSGKEIIWLPLNSLSQEESLKLLQQYRSFFLKEIVDKKEREKMDICIEKITLDCSGHPRLLEYFSFFLVKNRGQSFDYNQAISYISKKYNCLAHSSSIRLALRGDEMMVDALIREGVSFSGAIGRGELINTIEKENLKQIPRVSVVSMNKFQEECKSDKEYAWGNVQNKYLANALKWVGMAPEKMDWKDFEHFYCCWEVLFRLVTNEEEIDFTNDWLKGKAKISQTFENFKTNIQLPSIFRLNVGYDFYYGSLTRILTNSNGHVFDISMVYRTVKNQEGCDSISFFRTSDGKIKVMFVNAKFMQKDASEVSFDETIKQFCSLIKALSHCSNHTLPTLIDVNSQEKYVSFNKKSKIPVKNITFLNFNYVLNNMMYVVFSNKLRCNGLNFDLEVIKKKVTKNLKKDGSTKNYWSDKKIDQISIIFKKSVCFVLKDTMDQMITPSLTGLAGWWKYHQTHEELIKKFNPVVKSDNGENFKE